jgi:hypothetical protein
MLKWPGSTLTQEAVGSRRIVELVELRCRLQCDRLATYSLPRRRRHRDIEQESVCCRTSYSSSQSMLKNFTCRSVLTQLRAAGGVHNV